MKLFYNKYFISAVSLLLVLLMLTPSIVKLVHAIDEHEHFECNAIGQLHVHEVEFDCDFEKFNLSPQIYPDLVLTPGFLVLDQYKIRSQHYTFLSKFQTLHFSLRGPPSAS